MFSSEAWLANPSSGFYNGVATQSLRFDHGSSAYLSRTPSSTGDRKTWTWSGWIKRTEVTSSSDEHYIYTAHSGSNYFSFYFVGNKLGSYFGTGSNYGAISDRLFRDVSSWYHIVHQVDATNTTQKVWVNGEEQTLSSSRNPANSDYPMNESSVPMVIGKHSWGSSSFNNMYLAEVNYTDGQKYEASDFGETKNGVWIAKEPSVTYGTNGYRLQFKNTGVGTASTSTIGADTSGQTNHFTSSGIVASDCNMPDSPENNFCTLNSVGRRYGQSYVGTFSEGNLKVASGGNATNVFGTMAINQIASQGGVYFEVRMDSLDTSRTYFGVIGDDGANNKNPHANAGGYVFPIKGMLSREPNGHFGTNTDGNSTNLQTGNTAFSDGEVIGIAILSDGKFFAHREGTYLKDASGNVGNPSTGANPLATIDLTLGDWFPYLGYNSSFSINFGQDGSFQGNETSGGNQDGNGIGDFMFACPTNCFALCSSNMAEPTIGPNADTQADDHFNTVLYSGNDSTNNVTGVGFQPDWVWIKRRNASAFHPIHDSSRPTYAYLRTSGDNAENTDSGSDWFRSFNSDGFTVVRTSTGSGTTGQWNQSGGTFVAWNWLANGGTTSSNSSGSITSTVQANTTAGFSIVLWNGEGDGQATVGHGLGVKPQVIIPKNRGGAGSFHMYHEGVDSSAPEDYGILLNSTNARSDSANFHNDTAPTSSVFTVGTYNNFDYDYVAYCFAEVEGYSKFGSYTGNSNGDGTFVFTGFKPAWVMLKRSDSNTNGSWVILDNKRDATPNGNPNDTPLFPDGDFVEENNANRVVDFLSNGFKLRSASSPYILNVSGGTHIYMAFAEVPFKYSLAR